MALAHLQCCNLLAYLALNKIEKYIIIHNIYSSESSSACKKAYLLDDAKLGGSTSFNLGISLSWFLGFSCLSLDFSAFGFAFLSSENV